MSTLNEDIEVLTRMRTLLNNGWVQGTNAQDAEGNNQNPDTPGATCFCLGGALLKIVCEYMEKYEVSGVDAWISLGEPFYRNISDHIVKSLSEDKLRQILWENQLAYINDRLCSTKEEVLALIDTTIARLKGEVLNAN